MATKSTQASRATRLVATLLSLLAASASSHAAPWLASPDEYRIAQATGSFADTSQFAVVYRLHAPRALKAHHLELAAGSVWSTQQTEAFVSLGPVWRLPLSNDGKRFLDWSFSPTLISGSDFADRDIGGHLQFTSALAFGARFGRYEQFSLSLRAQHTSNGGLNEHNPGLDMVGLSFAIEFRE